MKRPLSETGPKGPSKSSSISAKPGDSSSGRRKVRPSSPPVMSDSCEASVRKAEATASVIMAKKIARTRSENRPMSSDSSNESSSAPTAPTTSAHQVGPMALAEMAMP